MSEVKEMPSATNHAMSAEEFAAQQEAMEFNKMAAMAQTSLDALRMMVFVKEQVALGKRISGICMGEKGQLTRILGRIFGNFIDYAGSIAPGQLQLQELYDI